MSECHSDILTLSWQLNINSLFNYQHMILGSWNKIALYYVSYLFLVVFNQRRKIWMKFASVRKRNKLNLQLQINCKF
jgi:hypothetical protein